MTDPSYNDHHNHTAVAIVFPCPGLELLVPDPHCTLIFLGKLPDISFTRDQVLDVLYDLRSWWGREESIRVPTDGYDLFGVEKNIPVIRLESPTLRGMRHYVESELAERHGIHSASQFDYQPHVTLSTVPRQSPPNSLTLTKPVLWWGDER